MAKEESNRVKMLEDTAKILVLSTLNPQHAEAELLHALAAWIMKQDKEDPIDQITFWKCGDCEAVHAKVFLGE